MILFGKTKFKSNDLKEDRGYTYKNPARGWYRPYPFDLCRDIDEAYMDTVISDREQICLVELLLSKDKSIYGDNWKEKLEHRIIDIFKYFIKYDKKIIVRATYDLDGDAFAKEPNLLKDIFEDMAVVAKVERVYSNEILLHQGLFIGNWGEMHGSRFTTDNSLIKLYQCWDNLIEGEIPVAVRTPKQLQLIDGKGDTAIAFFDDAICGSNTDMGTFDENAKDEEVAYINLKTKELLNGGEAVAGNGQISTEEVIKTMNALNISYLNSQYDKAVLENWKECKYKGILLYDYISSHLGYCFEVKQVNYSSREQHFTVVIKNTGFARWILSDLESIEWKLYLDGEEIEHSNKVVAVDDVNQEVTIKLNTTDLVIKGKIIVLKACWDDKPLYLKSSDVNGQVEIGAFQ